MNSAKLQVRPILLKKIFFVIFFNNRLTAYVSNTLPLKRKNQETIFSFIK